jgi:hypothetical protein
MSLIIFGIVFGLLIGTGIFGLLVYPALQERKKEKFDHQGKE